MRSVRGTRRCQRTAVAVDEGSNAIRVVSLSRDENLEIIGEADQSAVEHPMRCSRQCEAVADNVGAARFDRPDMRGIDLGAAATIDELQSTDRAALVIGTQHHAAKDAVTEDARCQRLESLAGTMRRGPI